MIYPRSVAATFHLAIIEVVNRCPAAETLMAYLGHCAPERIPMTLVEGAIDDEAECLEALAALAEVSLVTHNPFEDGTPAVTVHRLVQAVARARSTQRADQSAIVARLIARLVTLYPLEVDNPTSWPRCASLTPHLLAICQQEVADSAASAELVNGLDCATSYCLDRAAYSEAQTFCERALAIREALGAKHPEMARSLNNLGTLHFKAHGDYAGAKLLYERALAIS
jgi:hypothetical protein